MFFQCSVNRVDGLLAWDTATNGTYGEPGGAAERGAGKDPEDPKAVKRALATDMRGVPLMYRFHPGSLSDMETISRLESDIRRYGRDDRIFVMDRGFASDADIHGMLASGRRFVMPAKPEGKAVKKALAEFGRTADKKPRAYEKHAYDVWETEFGTVPPERTNAGGTQAYDITRDAGDGEKNSAFVCCDAKKYSDEIQNRELTINSLREHAENTDSPDPVKAFGKRAGKAAKYFDVKADGRKVMPTEKKNARAFGSSRAGIFVMLCSPGISRELMTAAYDARHLTEQVFDSGKEIDRRLGTPDPVTPEGRCFIRFSARTLRAEIGAVPRETESDANLTAESVLATMSTLDALEYGGCRGLSEVTADVRRILKPFGVEGGTPFSLNPSKNPYSPSLRKQARTMRIVP